MPIENQRHLFEIPENVAYLNCAYTAPLLRSVVKAGHQAIDAKSNPWTIMPAHFFSAIETLRSLFAQVIGSNSDHVAIVPAVSYGIALAARNLPVAAKQSIVVLQDQFPSNVYSWRNLAQQKGASITTVSRPADSNWTQAIVESIDSNTAIVACPNCHWTDGTLIDLKAVGEKCREVGAALVIDGAQSLGAMPFSVKDVRPDFVAAISHKWLLGAYSIGFCYVDKRWHGGTPLEENWMSRAGSEDFSGLVDYRDEYQVGARRFDVGEASNFILSPIASAALQQILVWGVEEIAQTLRGWTDSIADRAEAIGFKAPPRPARAPHLIGVSKPGGFPRELPQLLAREKVFVSVRGESIRISPHLYNTETDIERLFQALQKHT
jgi:selenocysteine lyase/cysteine desulfurase